MAQCIDTIGQQVYLGPTERLFGSFGRTVDKMGVSVVDSAAKLTLAILEWQRRSDERAALASVSDEMLKDVGLTRADIAAEAGKPFWLR